MSGFDDVPQPAPAADLTAAAGEFEVDLAPFLPEGVTLAVGDEGEEELEGDAEDAEPTAGSARSSTAGVDLDALRQIELDLDAVDAAIAAIDAGTYGVDAETGERIDDDLLAADPTRLS